MSNRCKKVAVLGSTGMLGHVVAARFTNDPKYITDCHCRPEFDAAHFVTMATLAPSDLSDHYESLQDVDYVINCIGGIRQRKLSREELITVNSLFPLALAKFCKQVGTRLIHVSTDCVYSGRGTEAQESDVPDPIDDYGWSKALGEPTDCMVIRTSLVGEELNGGNTSFLGWAKSQAGARVRGFTDHKWNGVTTKEFARICDDIITQDLYVEGTRHVFSPYVVSKAKMLDAFNERFNLQMNVIHTESGDDIDRTLNSNYDLCAILKVQGFHDMIRDM